MHVGGCEFPSATHSELHGLNNVTVSVQHRRSRALVVSTYYALFPNLTLAASCLRVVSLAASCMKPAWTCRKARVKYTSGAASHTVGALRC